MSAETDKWAPFNALPSWERIGVDRMATEAGHTLHSASTAAQIEWAIGYYRGVRPLSGYPTTRRQYTMSGAAVSRAVGEAKMVKVTDARTLRVGQVVYVRVWDGPVSCGPLPALGSRPFEWSTVRRAPRRWRLVADLFSYGTTDLRCDEVYAWTPTFDRLVESACEVDSERDFSRMVAPQDAAIIDAEVGSSASISGATDRLESALSSGVPISELLSAQRARLGSGFYGFGVMPLAAAQAQAQRPVWALLIVLAVLVGIVSAGFFVSGPDPDELADVEVGPAVVWEIEVGS